MYPEKENSSDHIRIPLEQKNGENKCFSDYNTIPPKDQERLKIAKAEYEAALANGDLKEIRSRKQKLEYIRSTLSHPELPTATIPAQDIISGSLIDEPKNTPVDSIPMPVFEHTGKVVAEPSITATQNGNGTVLERTVNETAHGKPDADDKTPAKSVEQPKWERQQAPFTSDDGYAVQSLEPKRYHLTDMGNGYRFAAKHGNDLRYCHPWKTWLVWDGTRWAKDSDGEIVRRAKDTVKSIYAEASHAQDSSDRRNIANHARRSEANSRLEAMIKQAQSELPVLPDELDSDPWLLNVKNGTLDLRTGELRPHNREDMITKFIPVTYDPDAQAPIWHGFLRRILNNNDNLVTFVQRAIGYSLTGDVSEQVFFMLYGTGANGKSVFLETVQSILGEDYAKSTPTSTIMIKNGSQNSNDLARLAGVRFVTVNEVEDGQNLAESLMKQLTGNDTITARFLYAEHFDYKPQFKLFIRANHKPVIKNTDEGIWRRIRLIPFTVTIPEEERDKRLLQKLKDELPGILAWAVEGCLEWQQYGLGMPEEVKQAVKEYRLNRISCG